MSNMSTVDLQIAERARAFPDEPLTNLRALLMRLCWTSAWMLSIKREHPEWTARAGANTMSMREERMPELLGAVQKWPVPRTGIRRSVHSQRGWQPTATGTADGGGQAAAKAVTRVLTPVYEQLFYPNSYGFRPGKSQHQALEVLFKEVSFKGKALHH
jgi:RNA-directed DNA polymerase